MYDDNGHGTHICGIIGGNGSLSKGLFQGMAPDARLVVGKVLDAKGQGATEYMLSGLDWILKNKDKLQIRILNISVGIGQLQDKRKEELLYQKIEQLCWEEIVVVCAAGNKGPAQNSISAISASPKVITVGCHDGSYCRNDPKRCETYSGRGKLYDTIRKPDIVAPGTNIRSCDANYEKGSPYTLKSGTSMATPIVTGAVALLLQKYPQISCEEVKRRLTYTASDLGLPWNQQGWGMLNVKKMLERY